MTTMRVLIVDDHSLLRAGLTLLLKERDSDAQVFEAESVSDGVEQALTHSPDAVLLSLDMSENRGFAALAALWQRMPLVPVVVISSDERAETVRRCLQMHAMGFVAKTARAHVLHLALEVAMIGGVFVPAASVGKTLACSETFCAPCADPSAHSFDRSPVAMTPRERETLSWLLRGLPTKSIASKMGVEDITIRKYVSHLLARFNVHRRTELIAMMSGHGTRAQPGRAFNTGDVNAEAAEALLAARFESSRVTTFVA
ncbi:Nitrate/nitrite response regulator protein [Caballeronia sordidicola]|uniref:Nitrate/nitrite response regulator protein n=2 Tax=Caballeronia sordidicola TaxID=196367 RepID=A0A242MKE9_CABSO|nr:Nitrate/nitrite response regulator protein [Caballeronia sordidicola]